MFLTLPGIGGSGPGHWQSLWEKHDADFRRVVQDDWENPNLADWLGSTSNAVVENNGRVVLVAHSLSCLLVPFLLQAEEEIRQKIAGLFLVAIPDPASPIFPERASAFAAHPRTTLWCPVFSVLSEDDPYGTVEYASALTRTWGGQWISLGKYGHVNEGSGLAEWRHGRDLLSAFAAGIGHGSFHSTG